MPMQQKSRDWRSWFAFLSAQLATDSTPKYTEVRLRSKEGDARCETPWLPLGRISYDRADNLLKIVIEDRARLVFRPAELCANTPEGATLRLRVEQKGHTGEILELR